MFSIVQILIFCQENISLFPQPGDRGKTINKGIGINFDPKRYLKKSKLSTNKTYPATPFEVANISKKRNYEGNFELELTERLKSQLKIKKTEMENISVMTMSNTTDIFTSLLEYKPRPKKGGLVFLISFIISPIRG